MSNPTPKADRQRELREKHYDELMARQKAAAKATGKPEVVVNKPAAKPKPKGKRGK